MDSNHLNNLKQISPLRDARTTSSSHACNDPVPLSAKRKRFDYVYHRVKTKKSPGTLGDTKRSTNCMTSENEMRTEPLVDPFIESRSYELSDGVAPMLDMTCPPSNGIISVASDPERFLTFHRHNSSRRLLSTCFCPGLAPITSPRKLLDELSSLLADINDLIQGCGIHLTDFHQTSTQAVTDSAEESIQGIFCQGSSTHTSDVPTNELAVVDSAKETIRGIFSWGFEALTNSEAQETFLASSEVLLSAGVFPVPSDHFKLTAFRNDLAQNAAAYLQAQKDIHMVSELSSLQEFLLDEGVKLRPALQERFRVADEKIAQLRAIFDAALAKRAKMNAVLTAFVEQTTFAKQKLASINPQVVDNESKKRAAEKLMEQCDSCWVDLRNSLLRFL